MRLINAGPSSGTSKAVELGGPTSSHPTMLKGHDETVYLDGARFWLMSMAMAIMMFLTNLEVPVVTTALVAITDDLQGFDSTGWVVASYLLGYVAVIVICAKFSDILGRKFMFLFSTALFIVFSAACSASQTILQLIIFRALQGVGGGGCFSLCTIMVIEIVPPEKYAKYVANITVVNALALLLGPIVGGAIASRINWRWIFIIKSVSPGHVCLFSCSVGMGAGAQFRMIGSAMILAISTSVFNGYARPQLQALLGSSDTNALTQLTSLPQALQEEVRYALSEAYNRQNIVLCASAAMQIPASLLMWKREQVVI
ncbi:hypothetical protein DL768_002411 [Monosporascus sp. mg162]|nr:hypothetical protein DL768_002411 [Monosporascus sp. mg162]